MLDLLYDYHGRMHGHGHRRRHVGFRGSEGEAFWQVTEGILLRNASTRAKS